MTKQTLDTENQSLSDLLDAALPQTQCTRCGYPACRPYARAMASGEAPINRCPPGGQAGIDTLADILGTKPPALDPAFGSEGPRLVARIESEHCIGCTKCIVACPVDAIIGGPKWMHTVLPALCSGCELCVAPCPVDCIRIEALAQTDAPAWLPADANGARMRFEARALRRRRNDELDTMRHIDEAAEEPASVNSAPDPGTDNEDDKQARKRAILEAAIARARARQASKQ